MKYQLRYANGWDCETNLFTWPIAVTGTISEIVSYARRNGLRWVRNKNLLLEGYYTNADGSTVYYIV